MKILITGCAGFIGFHLSKRLCEMKHKVYGIDNLNDYYDPLLKKARIEELKKISRKKNVPFLLVNKDLESNIS